MAERHNRDVFLMAKTGELRGLIAPSANPGEGAVEAPLHAREATESEAKRLFRFSELVCSTSPLPDEDLLEAVAEIMTTRSQTIDSHNPAGYTYLGQFIDHDLSHDPSRHIPLGSGAATPERLEQARSPALDLDALYGAGPAESPQFFQADAIRLKVGKTRGSGQVGRPDARDLLGFDLPRRGSQASEPEDFRKAQIPDPRNDENLAVAQIHLAFIRFHNSVCDRLAAEGIAGPALFEQARELVCKHYQWLVVNDYLPRIVDPAIVADVFTSGRVLFEPGATDLPTLPLEFAVGAFRLGHAMIRERYEWNACYRSNGIIGDLATLLLLMTASGGSGNLSPGTNPDHPLAGNGERLPTGCVADWSVLFDFVEAGVPELAPETFLNRARPIAPHLTDPLKTLPVGAFGPRLPSIPSPPPTDKRRNLAFRNLLRGRMVKLATGQELAARINERLSAAGRGAEAITPLSRDQILGEEFLALSAPQQDLLAAHTPLWLYVLREASLNTIHGQEGTGRLGAVGGRIVAEVFQRAIERSRISFLRDPAFTPTLGPAPGVFRMADLLLVAYDASQGELRPLSPSAPRPGRTMPAAGKGEQLVRDLCLQTPHLLGADVIALQTALNRRGAALIVDGVFGEVSRAAVLSWQKERGLVADGLVGIETRSSLGLQRLLRLQDPPQQGDDVRALQPVLEREAKVVLRSADGGFDGVFGPLTASAVCQVQSLRRLQLDGVVGPLTLRSLGLIG